MTARSLLPLGRHSRHCKRQLFIREELVREAASLPTVAWQAHGVEPKPQLQWWLMFVARPRALGLSPLEMEIGLSRLFGSPLFALEKTTQETPPVEKLTGVSFWAMTSILGTAAAQ